MRAADLSIAAQQPVAIRVSSVVPAISGFFFVARYAFTFLFFQNDPANGSLALIGIGLLLTYAALITDGHKSLWTVWRLTSTTRWVALYLLFTATSIFWSGAPSKSVALAYWIGIAADVAIALILMSDPLTRSFNLHQMLKGAACGGVALAVIGWLSPTLPDLRLGDLVLLHPNTLGLQLGLTSLIAFYLVSQGRAWKAMAIFLAVTLLRTLSKTSILAFAIASIWMLMHQITLTRAQRLKIVVFACIVVGCFSGLLISYLNIYNGGSSGNQLETLTGRTFLWITALGLSMQTPWLGHGFYSFRALIPSFGDFEPWHAHNELIQIFFEFGAVGIAIAIGLHWRFFRCIRRFRTAMHPLALSLLIFSLLHGLTDTVPFGFSLPLWLISALSLAAHSEAVQ